MYPNGVKSEVPSTFGAARVGDAIKGNLIPIAATISGKRIRNLHK